MNSTLLSKTCSFQGSFEGTRAEVKLMPAPDVHKLGSIALPPVKNQKTCSTPPRTPVPSIPQDNPGTEIGISRIMLYAGHRPTLANNVKPKVILVITGATGTISKSFRRYGRNISGNHEVKELQKTAILGTAHIIWKVLT